MDSRFDQMFDDPWVRVFKVVFYPVLLYHAAYFNATRSSRYRYNVLEVRNAFDITVLKAEVYVDGVFLGNVLRVEYRASRLTEVARERNRFLRNRVIMQIRLLTSDPNAPPAGPSATLSLHYDKWINAYQTEIWETVTLPQSKHHDFKVLDQIGRMGPITTVADSNYLVDFQRGHFFDNVDTIAPVRYRNGMMEPSDKESRGDNIIEMRWVLQREFASSVVFFHKVTIPPGAIEGTHRHIGTEELYCIVEGEGIAYMGDDDDPALSRYPLVTREIYGLGLHSCREVPVKPGSVIYTKSGGIHGIRNPSADKPLRFVAFLYHTA